MRSLPILPLFLANALAATAPAPAVAQSNILLTSPPSGYGCPVGLTVERQSGLRLFPAAAPQPGQPSRSIHPSPDAQGVHVRLTDHRDRAIVSADIVVHGYTARPRITPASTGPEEDLTKTFHLTAEKRSTSVLASDLWVENMGSIRSVTITSIEYASGPIWQTSKAAFCTATPSLFLLVGSLR